MATPPKRKKDDCSDLVCDNCHLTFSVKGNLTRHQVGAVCLKNSANPEPSIPTHVTDDGLNSAIVDSIGDKYLAFICSQRLGVYRKQFYPLCFVEDEFELICF